MPHTPSPSALIAIAALGILGFVGGWLIVLSGGFHHAAHRYTTETTFVGGAPAIAMASIFFALTAMALAVLLQSRRAAWPWYWVACGVVLLPPLFFVFAK